jgi:hypothetical protein
MGTVPKSVQREIAQDDVRSFSSFHDLLQQRIDRGEIASLEDLLGRKPALLGSILFDWYRQGQIACVFAQRLARDPISANWQSVVVKGRIDPTTLSSVLEEAAKKLDALQLIFPGPGTAEQAVEIMNKLCSSPEWTISEVDWLPDEQGDSLQVGLRWQAPSGEYSSWVLGIAPFDSMPFTRRFEGAPFIALVFRPSPPTSFAKTPKDETGKDASHLAHMDDQLGSNQQKREQSTTVTQRAKDALLGPELRSTARAKVTFSLPGWCRERLVGLMPSTRER